MENSLTIIIVALITLLIIIYFVKDRLSEVSFKVLSFIRADIKTHALHGTAGRGGNAVVNGSGTAIGGPGGESGPYGNGGEGGSATVNGGGVAVGGEGGGAAQLDRGGKGGRSGFEVSGTPNRQLPDGTWLHDYGRGGNGGNSSEVVTDKL